MDHERLRRLHGGRMGSMARASFKVRLKARAQIARDTWAFTFDKPSGFQFRAGQHVRMTLIKPHETDGEGNSRFLSLVSAPKEPDLVFAMRMRDSAFKRVLGRMPIGTKVLVEYLLDVPSGAFALPADPSRLTVFVAGGIGVVPAYCMIKDGLSQTPARPMVLFLSNRRPEDAPYLDELRRLARQHPAFRLIATMTDRQLAAAAWTGETGRVDQAMLKRHLSDLTAPIYFVSGLPGMVDAIKTTLANAGVDQGSVKVEAFSGFDLNEIHQPPIPVRRGRLVSGLAVLAVGLVVLAHLGAAIFLYRHDWGEFSASNPLLYLAGGTLLGLLALKAWSLRRLRKRRR